MGILDRGFKLMFAFKLTLLVSAGVFGATVVLYLAALRDMGSAYGEAFTVIYKMREELFPMIFASFFSIAFLILVTASIAGISVVYSHKIAGPIFRLEKHLEAIGQGDFTVTTKFRRHDQLHEFADIANEMTRSLNHRVRSIVDGLSDLRDSETTLRHLMAEDAGREEVKKAFSEMSRAVDEFKRVRRMVKLKGDG
ncbi:MAG: hypothetical protein HY880_03595 [Deltaproteobacteria bacterium]|nr:hypothetical protein [Deltaproteobacteria bacterium]